VRRLKFPAKFLTVLFFLILSSAMPFTALASRQGGLPSDSQWNAWKLDVTVNPGYDKVTFSWTIPEAYRGWLEGCTAVLSDSGGEAQTLSLGTATSCEFSCTLRGSVSWKITAKFRYQLADKQASGVTPALTTVAPVTDLAVTDITNRTAAVSWTPSTSGVLHYVVEWRETNGANPASVTLPSTARATVLENLRSSAHYTVSVTARYRTLLSEPLSAEFRTMSQGGAAPNIDTPYSPGVGQVTDTSVSLTWGKTGGASGHNLYRSANGGSPVRIPCGTSTSYTDTGLQPSTRYTYYLEAYGSDGTARTSAAVDVITKASAPKAPASPTGLTASRITSSSVTLSWLPPSGAVSYQVLRANPSGSGYLIVAYVTGTTHTDTGLEADHVYRYCVRAVGENALISDPCGTVEVRTAKLPVPSVPRELTASTLNDTQISLSWEYSANAAGYRIYRSEYESGPFTRIATESSLHYRDTALTPSTVYWYRVTAYNAAGESSRSYAVRAVTAEAPPQQTLNAKIENVTSASLLIHWNVVKGATCYRVFRSGPEDKFFLLVELDPKQTSYTDRDLAAATDYSYKVQAVVQEGVSFLVSPVVTVTTAAAPPDMRASLTAPEPQKPMTFSLSAAGVVILLVLLGVFLALLVVFLVRKRKWREEELEDTERKERIAIARSRIANEPIEVTAVTVRDLTGSQELPDLSISGVLRREQDFSGSMRFNPVNLSDQSARRIFPTQALETARARAAEPPEEEAAAPAAAKRSRTAGKTAQAAGAEKPARTSQAAEKQGGTKAAKGTTPGRKTQAGKTSAAPPAPVPVKPARPARTVTRPDGAPRMPFSEDMMGPENGMAESRTAIPELFNKQKSSPKSGILEGKPAKGGKKKGGEKAQPFDPFDSYIDKQDSEGTAE